MSFSCDNNRFVFGDFFMIYLIAIIGGSILIDQLFKYIASIYQPVGVSILGGFIEFNYTLNDGASYGIFSGSQLLLSLITVIALVILGFIIAKSNLKKNKIFGIGLALILGGTFGNAIDRVVLGSVIDFLHYPWLAKILPSIGNFSNNPADLFLFFGLILVVIHILFLDKRKKSGRNKNSETKPKS